MRYEAPEKPADYAPLVFPALMLIVFFVVPFGIMIAVSFFQRQQGGFYTPDFVFSNYERFLTPFFGGVLGFSLMLAALVAVICVSIAFPFTYLVTRLRRRYQILWLIALLSILSLSEVIIGFAWSTLFSRTAGITNLFVAVGLMDRPVALLPGFGAVVTGMVYQALTYTILVLYPVLVRLDPTLLEAARTLGASPVRAFWHAVFPQTLPGLLAGIVLVAIPAFGMYVIPELLGGGKGMMLGNLVANQFSGGANWPLGAAGAILMLIATFVGLFAMRRIGKRLGGGEEVVI